MCTGRRPRPLTCWLTVLHCINWAVCKCLQRHIASMGNEQLPLLVVGCTEELYLAPTDPFLVLRISFLCNCAEHVSWGMLVHSFLWLRSLWSSVQNIRRGRVAAPLRILIRKCPVGLEASSLIQLDPQLWMCALGTLVALIVVKAHNSSKYASPCFIHDGDLSWLPARNVARPKQRRLVVHLCPCS